MVLSAFVVRLIKYDISYDSYLQLYPSKVVTVSIMLEFCLQDRPWKKRIVLILFLLMFINKIYRKMARRL